MKLPAFLTAAAAAALLTLQPAADAEAQYSRRDYPGTDDDRRRTTTTASSTGSDYRAGGDVYARGSRYGDARYGADRRLSRRERARYQQRLEQRAEGLDDRAARLERREARLDGRRPRANRAPSRRQYTGRLLSTRELYDWDARLDRRAYRLRDRADDIARRERRADRRRGNRGRGNGRGNGNRGGGGDYCPPGW